MDTKLCSKCETEKPIDSFYPKSDRKNGSAYCKACTNSYSVNRWVQRKINAIQYKGDSCADCGISYPEFPYVIFDFHHLDPTEKDVDWTKLRLRAWESIKLELDKCVLLCSNCHRIRHHAEKCTRQDSNL